MCGIFAILNYYKNYSNNSNNSVERAMINDQFMKGKKRGPEYSVLDQTYFKMMIGFHRLAINGLNAESNQPIVFNNIVLICNGEIYNYKQLYKYMDIHPTTDSDCEVIIHLYLNYGIEQTLNMLDGVYSFLLYDNRMNDECINHVYVARDPYGVRPLYQMHNKNVNDKKNTYKYNDPNYNLHMFASELKCLEFFYNLNREYYHIEQFNPGTYSKFELNDKVNAQWTPIISNKPYFMPTFSYTELTSNHHDLNVFKDYIFTNIAKYLNLAVIKRCDTTERPVACLLSGGLDSSIIAALVSLYFKKCRKQIETYSIGLQNSEDIKYAKIVAEYIGSKHTEIIVTEDEMFKSIPEVIQAIESYDTTTIRASIGNYLIGKYISANSDAKVIFNGDGSDEIFGGYLYMSKCPDDIEFDKETRRLLKDIHLFDVLRSDKSISSNGLEPRTPFLDKTFVNYVLSIPVFFRNHTNFFNEPEKYLLRHSFTEKYFNDNGKSLLPDEILWRKKEAFSDGVSSHGRSLYTILQEKIAERLNNHDIDIIDININEHTFEPNIRTEKLYYKHIFDNEFPNCEHLLPYFWMPKYIESTDPSARTLVNYTS